MLTHLLANFVAALHLAYALFVILGTIAILVGAGLGWTWIRSFPFRVLHIAAVYIVLLEEVFGIQCPLNVLAWELRSASGGPAEATEGFGGLLDGLLFRTIPGWALDVLYWSLGVGLLVLLFVVPPRWPSFRRTAAPE
jgi:hypothetical protein